MIFLISLQAQASGSWYLQVDDPQVDQAVLRRTIALELRELSIPGDPSRADESEADVSLHIEVLREQDRLNVSIWDRGEHVGRRQVSALGQSKLVARRVGLAVAELARDLRDRRTRLARQLKAEQELSDRRALAAAYRSQKEALGLRAGLETQILPQGAWLLGPRVGVEFNNYFPLRFTVAAGWYAGSLPLLNSAALSGNAPAWSKWEFQWGADWVRPMGIRTQFSLGAQAAASAVHVGNGVQVDGISGQEDTWSAQLGLRSAFALHLSPSVSSRLELGGGRVLRPIPVALASAQEKLGGWYLSAALSLSLYP